jgi:superfamily II DNA/RNA helicase
VDFFPKKREMPPNFMRMGDLQQKFYNAVEELADTGNEKDQRAFGTVLRMIAAHPASLLTSQGEIARGIVEAVTPEGIRQIPSVKTEKLIEWCNTVVRDQGAQAVVFTFFAQSVLPLLNEALVDSGFTVSTYHGQLSDAAKSDSKRTFRNGETQIFLTGDSAQRGVNLPQATYLLHYERPSSHTAFVQRSDRIDRIDSLAEAIFIYSFVVHDSFEEGLYNLGLRRNEWSDKLVDDDDFDNTSWISAQDRKNLLKLGRKLLNSEGS